MKKKEQLSPVVYVFGIVVLLATMYIGRVFLFPQAEKAYLNDDVESAAEDECMFDLLTQTDDFLKNNPWVKKYKWNDEDKQGVVYLDSGDSIEIRRGGCNHFSFECSKDVGSLASLKAPKEEFALKTAIGLAVKYYDKEDALLVDSLVSHQDYKVKRTDKSVYWYLNYEGYDLMEIALSHWEDIDSYSISVEYTIN